MNNIACITISAFGFFFGTREIVYNITGYLSYSDYPTSIALFVYFGVYIGLCLSGFFAYKKHNFAKYIVATCVASWLYFQFSKLFWPINMPDFQAKMGNTGFSAWKPAVDIIAIGILYGSALVMSTIVLFKASNTKINGG